MAVPVAALAKLAAAALSGEDTRRRLGWIVAAICSPLILTLALICALLSGSAEHNNSAVLLCFNGGTIPNKTPAEYVAYIEDMRRCFTLLDDAIAAVNGMTENSNSLDGIRVKAVFYAIFFGEDTPSRRAHRQFVDCFVTYEERTRTVTDEDGTETEESYTVALPITDIAAVYGNIDGQEIRQLYPQILRFTVDGAEVVMKHIGGYPGNYDPSIKGSILVRPPKLFISGHSHILKVKYDKTLDVLHINPGAAGIQGFHKVRTMVRFAVDGGTFKDLEVIELADR